MSFSVPNWNCLDWLISRTEHNGRQKQTELNFQKHILESTCNAAKDAVDAEPGAFVERIYLGGELLLVIMVQITER